MVAVVIFIAILTIVIAAVGPSISTIMRREREEELLFRGKQYARSIALFQRRYGRYPTSLKEMYTNRPRTIRKLWKEPICDCNDWKLLIQGQPDSTSFADQNVDPSNRPPSTYSGLMRTPTPWIVGSGKEGQPVNVGPIIGVRSKVHQQALREWRGRRYYDQWRFIVGDADSDLNIPFNPYTLRSTPAPRTRP
ncbi:MAG TPA: type II secretion system protein [Thermoanaerobaculia bacterium]|jgi:type II secretory pathway pseudopilin PulG